MLLILGIILAATSLTAQVSKRSGNRQGSPDPKNLINELKEELLLSEAQVEQITEIFNERKNEKKGNRNVNEDQNEMKEQIEQERKQIDKKIMSVLDEKQKKLYEEWKQNHKADEKGRRGKDRV
jgi:signal recognition particle GTPase